MRFQKVDTQSQTFGESIKGGGRRRRGASCFLRRKKKKKKKEKRKKNHEKNQKLCGLIPKGNKNHNKARCHVSSNMHGLGQKEQKKDVM